MKILQVNYSRQLPKGDLEQAKRMSAAAEKLAQLPGLLWKLWAYDDDQQRAVSYYLFDSEQNARAWGEGPLRASLGSQPGIGDITTQYFDVDVDLSRITRGPVADSEAAVS